MSVTNPPKITVLMSVYNGARWLSESIESVLHQTFTDFEFVIVNDGSTDGTLPIIKQYSKRDTRIRILDKENTGLADSLNYGILFSRGHWIARIDADDICEPDRLDLQMRCAVSAPDLVLIGSGLRIIDANGALGQVYLYPKKTSALSRRLVNAGAFFPHSSAFFNSKAVREVGGYRKRIKRAEDFDLWLRLSEKGSIACIDKPLVKIRKHENQISHEDSGRRQMIDSRLALVSYWLRQRGANDPTSPNAPQETFNAFQRFVKDSLHESGFFKIFDFERKIRECIRQDTRLLAFLALSKVFIGKPNAVYSMVMRRAFGCRLAKKIAKAWCDETKSIVQ